MFDEKSCYAFGDPQYRTRFSAVAAVRRSVWCSLEKTQNAVPDRDGGRWTAVEPSSAHPLCPTESGPGFFVILPPLLYSAAWLTSWREFSYNLVSILFLAFGLVTFTVLGVTVLGNFFLPGFDWRVGLVLGAVVAPTDAIAAASIAKRVGLPKRLVDILEGESLLNDASALLALEFGLVLLVGGVRPTFTFGLLRLLYLTVVGILIGLGVGIIVHGAEDRIDDGPMKLRSAFSHLMQRI